MGALSTDPSHATSALPRSPSATPLKKALQVCSCFHLGIATHGYALLLLFFPLIRAELIPFVEGDKTN